MYGIVELLGFATLRVDDALMDLYVMRELVRRRDHSTRLQYARRLRRIALRYFDVFSSRVHGCRRVGETRCAVVARAAVTRAHVAKRDD